MVLRRLWKGSSVIDLERLRAKDENEWHRCISEHGWCVRAAVRRVVRHPDDRDDVVQSAWQRIIARVVSLEHEAYIGTWMYRVARNVALDHIRGCQREHAALERAASGCTALMDAGQEAGLLTREILRGVSPNDRRYLELSAIGWRDADIAIADRVPITTAKSRLFRARQAARRMGT